VAEQGHYAGRTRPSNTRQGTYATAPSGVMLASINSNDPVRVAEMLERALAKWKTLSREERLLAADPATAPAELRRHENRYPEGGLVLRVNTRDLPREVENAGRYANAWNWDYAWFTAEEAAQWVPARRVTGESALVPEPLVRRLVRFHLLDNVRGQTIPFDEEDVEKARITSTVTSVRGTIVTLRLEGETRAAGEAEVRDRGEMGPQKYGFETRILGTAEFDTQLNRFVKFEALAVGTRWGRTQYNFRRGDLEPSGIGVALTLAGDTPAEKVAPAHFYRYGWR
jgi:hypothetical protein